MVTPVPSLRRYYQGSKAAICVFAVNDADSFVGAKDWVKEMRSKATENAIIVLCANKVDTTDRRVSREEADSFAAANGLLYIEASAKTGENVDLIFNTLAAELPQAERQRLHKNLKLLQLQLQILELEQSAHHDVAKIDRLVQERRQLGGDMAVMDLSREEIQAEIRTVQKTLASTGDDGSGSGSGGKSSDDTVDLTRQADFVVRRNAGCC